MAEQEDTARLAQEQIEAMEQLEREAGVKDASFGVNLMTSAGGTIYVTGYIHGHMHIGGFKFTAFVAFSSNPDAATIDTKLSFSWQGASLGESELELPAMREHDGARVASLGDVKLRMDLEGTYSFGGCEIGTKNEIVKLEGSVLMTNFPKNDFVNVKESRGFGGFEMDCEKTVTRWARVDVKLELAPNLQGWGFKLPELVYAKARTVTNANNQMIEEQLMIGFDITIATVEYDFVNSQLIVNFPRQSIGDIVAWINSQAQGVTVSNPGKTGNEIIDNLMAIELPPVKLINDDVHGFGIGISYLSMRLRKEREEVRRRKIGQI